MKHLSKNILGLLILTTVIIWFTGCEQDPQLKKYVYPMPQVTGMSPNIGLSPRKLLLPEQISEISESGEDILWRGTGY